MTVTNPNNRSSTDEPLTAVMPPPMKLAWPSRRPPASPDAPEITADSSSEADSSSIVTGAAMLTASIPSGR